VKVKKAFTNYFLQGDEYMVLKGKRKALIGMQFHSKKEANFFSKTAKCLIVEKVGKPVWWHGRKWKPLYTIKNRTKCKK